jgi:hypothetical protein
VSGKRKSAESGAPRAPRGLGEIAYDAYAEAVGGHSVKGDVLPRFADQDSKVADAWSAAAHAVLTATYERNTPR